MKYIKRFFVFFTLTLIAIAFVIMALPLCLLCFAGLSRIISLMLNGLASWWARLIVRMSGSTVYLAGTENIPRSGPVCFVSNHSGIFDIVLCLAYIKRPFGFIAKKELGFIPFLNLWIVLLGGLFIERNSPRKALETLRKGTEQIKKGGGMIIFPEGTRSKGRGLLPFKPGALKMAVDSGAPVVPVAITGSYDVFEKTGFINAAEVFFSFGKPLNQAEITDDHKRQALAALTHDAIQELLTTHTRPALS